MVKNLVPKKLQGYFDASGTKEHRTISLAGFVTEREAWASFSTAWDAALKRYRLKVFKMQLEKRNARVSEFSAIIKKHVSLRIDSSISVPHFSSAVTKSIAETSGILPVKPHVSKIAKRLLDDPYFFLIGNLVSAFCHGIWERGHREQCDLYFDKQILEMCPSSDVIYDMIKTLALPRFQQLLPDRLKSRDDEIYKPLQAADMLAWISRKRREGDLNGLSWLIAELDSIEAIPCIFMDAKSLLPQMAGFYTYVFGRMPRFEKRLIERWSTFIS